MATKQRIKKGDTVIVIAGKERGKTGKVVRVLGEDDRVIVERINIVKRHRKPQGQQPGGIVEKEAPLHLSNVMVLCPTSNTRTRVGRKVLDNGRHVRVSRKSGEVLDAK